MPCTCCYDLTKGTQDKDFSYSSSDSLSAVPLRLLWCLSFPLRSLIDLPLTHCTIARSSISENNIDILGLFPTETSCKDKGQAACGKSEVCCPLTKICVIPKAPCVTPCADTGSYCCPVTSHCAAPTNPGVRCVQKGHGTKACPTGQACCPTTKVCVKLGATCTSP